jgi:RNA polymerase sigma factor (sigma-70 family)
VVGEPSGIAWFVRPGDDGLFAELYRRHYRPIRDFCRRRVASDLVDDAVAETFLTAWRRFDDVPAGDEALVWLYRVAFRVIGHQWRSMARRRRLELRMRSLGCGLGCVGDESVIDGEEHRLVLDAAARLGDTDAEVLRLVAWEQLSIVDIAAVLEIAPNAVKQRLHRAKRNLAREYRRLESRRAPAVALKGATR